MNILFRLPTGNQTALSMKRLWNIEECQNSAIKMSLQPSTAIPVEVQNHHNFICSFDKIPDPTN